MENMLIKTDRKNRPGNLPLVKYVYKNNKRCRFNVYGLKNYETFAKYLIDKFTPVEGINNIKPSIVTGNLLIEFDPLITWHEDIFKELKTVVKTFVETESFAVNKTDAATSFSIDEWSYYPLPERETHSSQCNHNCSSCTDQCFEHIYKSIDVNYILSFAVKTTGSLLLQKLAKKFVRRSLYSLIF